MKMDKYRPCPSIIAMFTSNSQHPPRSRHAVDLGEATKEHKQMSKQMTNVVTSMILFDLILYVPSTIFQLNRDGSSWVEPVLS